MSSARSWQACAALCWLLAGSASTAAADATFVIESADPAGQGFDDPTPVAPVGGNAGTTLGAQRRRALQYAADLWGAALDSTTPIVVRAQFADVDCNASGAVLAYASPFALEIGIDRNGADPDLIYPSALANRLWGSDLWPGQPDIRATFNARIDAGCIPGTKWYYGLDGKHGDDQDLVITALHELGHGLGMVMNALSSDGVFAGDAPSSYAKHVLDLSSGKHWDEMTAAERVTSFTNARNVVWDGARVSAAAARLLVAGTPVVQVSPGIAGFSGLASDASYGGSITSSASAQLVSAADGCPTSGLRGRVVLLRDGCAHSSWAARAQRAGAVGVVLAWPPYVWSAPPNPIDEPEPEPVSIPVLTVSAQDADLLRSASTSGTVTVMLSFAAARRGTDAQGRVLLSATTPSSSSSVSHWDELARPNLLMEPTQKSDHSRDLDLTPALLADIGWAPFCGNGELDSGEACDDGTNNSDTRADACRSDCTRARCGDGTRDQGEACDQGANSDVLPDVCRSDCSLPRCGDGVQDHGEACDEGASNSDGAADACRGDCTAARCGDGVRDRGEACDEGAANSDATPDACRSDCSAPSCGDGVRDQGEGCDRGAANSDTTPDACRSDCTAARCGDAVSDRAEACDRGPLNSDREPDACRSDCRAARCGDGVVDRDERCDRGDGSSCTNGCPAGGMTMAGPDAGAVAGRDAGPAAPGAGSGSGSGSDSGSGSGSGSDSDSGSGSGSGSDSDSGSDSGSGAGSGSGSDSGGCGCRVVSRERVQLPAVLTAVLFAAATVRVRRRRLRSKSS